MRTPIQQFAKQENVTVRYLYKEATASRLTLTKQGRRTYVTDEDGARWRALALKVTGAAGDVALQAAEQRIEQLGRVVAAGQINRDVVLARLAAVTAKVGLSIGAYQTTPT